MLLMRDNDPLDQAAEILAGSPASDLLLDVDLSQNSLGLAGTQELGGSAHLRGLLVLRLADNSISDFSAAALAASPLGQRLSVLELDNLPPAPR